MIAAQLRIRLALLRAVHRDIDRSKQIVLLFVVVIFGQFTLTDPALWIAPLKPLLQAPLDRPTAYLPCLLLGLLACGIGVMARPVFDWTPHSRSLAQVPTSRLASSIADGMLIALLVGPFAAIMTAGLLVRAVVDGPAIATLALFVLLIATWVRVAAASTLRASIAVGATAIVFVAIGTTVRAPALLVAALLITATAVVAAKVVEQRIAGRLADRSWRTGSPSIDVWLRLHRDTIRARSPWLFLPTLGLIVVGLTAIDLRAGTMRDASDGTRDVVRLISGLLLLWQLIASTAVASLAMQAWTRSRVLLQLPRRARDHLVRIGVASVVLLIGASPAEAMSLGISHNEAGSAWATLIVAAPWVVAWAQSRTTLRGVLVWVASIAVVLRTVGTL